MRQLPWLCPGKGDCCLVLLPCELSSGGVLEEETPGELGALQRDCGRVHDRTTGHRWGCSH